MNQFVTISPRANEELNHILAYLELTFGLESSIKCIEDVENICWQIAAFPYAFPAFKGKSIRKAVISRYLTMFYQVKKETIEVLSFWDNRKNTSEIEI
ncbi:MAG: type II toxin-antitoxin system RelE/ParE family toxin [Saprospiraceae bacterium]